DFLLSAGDPAIFLFSTIDGTIAGWNPAVGLEKGQKPPSTHAVTVVKTKDGSVYTGLTSAEVDGKRYLYAANFSKGRVDVWDSKFKPVTFQTDPWELPPFTDDLLPPEYVPFNAQAIGDEIVVTYALHQPGMPVETDGPGLGYVDVYSATGELRLHLEHGDWLNAPWGVALAPLDFGKFSHSLLIGQFAGGGTTESSGWIAAYNLTTGHFEGLLKDAAGKPLAIQGIWALSPGNVSPGNLDAAASPAAEVYFTAGPKAGSEGLFGYLTAIPTELVQGNDQ
ncbi:MAG: TIGR03118 family protein, partial [Silvibacterium sp.]|nr:TIGR03118 family protein [Silvibacterium sp.]